MKKTSFRPITLTTHVILVFFSALMIYPVLLVILGSLKSQRELYVNPWSLPKVPRFVSVQVV